MADSKGPYYTPMDKSYHVPITEAPLVKGLETPILPIDMLGETVPESDPQGRNIIQTTQAAIRGGAGTLQIVMTTSHQAAIGGRFKAMGSEVRQALKEVALANNVKLKGVELPTSLKNLSGFDYQRNEFSEEARREGLEEVKDAIRFTADTAGGGGIDIVSWEFPRAVNDAKWNKDAKGKPIFERAATDEQFATLVDTKEGRLRRISKVQPVYIPFDPVTFEDLTPEPGQPIDAKVQNQKFEWKNFVAWAEDNIKHNKENKLKPGDEKFRPEYPEQILAEKQLSIQVKQTQTQALIDKQRAQRAAEEYKDNKEKFEGAQDPAKKKEFENKMNDAKSEYEQFIKSYYANEQNAKEIEQFIKGLQPIEQYGVARSAHTYAEAGIVAMQQTKDEKKPLYVGPEIGWPDYYGSHPEEFTKLVDESRKKMVQLLTTKEQIDPITNKPKLDKEGKPVLNPYYDERLSADDAKKKAADHVKGLFDTSHMGMWLAHFKPIIDPKTRTQETEDARLKRFNGWFTDRVKELAEATKKRGLVGGIQLVDSASAAHGHLPPGQGIFPVIEAAEIFKKNGYGGFMVSEGHEEEKFGAGRIRTKTWQKAGANIGGNYYGTGSQLQWGQIQNGYFGKTYSPLFMFGSYAPSNDFKLWSEVPLE